MYLFSDEALKSHAIYSLENDRSDIVKSALKELFYLKQNKVDELTSFEVMDNYRFEILSTEEIPLIENCKYKGISEFKMFFSMKCEIQKKEVFRLIACLVGKGTFHSSRVEQSTWYTRSFSYTYYCDEVFDLELKNYRAIDLTGEKEIYCGLDENGEWD